MGYIKISLVVHSLLQSEIDCIKPGSKVLYQILWHQMTTRVNFWWVTNCAAEKKGTVTGSNSATDITKVCIKINPAGLRDENPLKGLFGIFHWCNVINVTIRKHQEAGLLKTQRIRQSIGQCNACDVCIFNACFSQHMSLHVCVHMSVRAALISDRRHDWENTVLQSPRLLANRIPAFNTVYTSENKM